MFQQFCFFGANIAGSSHFTQRAAEMLLWQRLGIPCQRVHQGPQSVLMTPACPAHTESMADNSTCKLQISWGTCLNKIAWCIRYIIQKSKKLNLTGNVGMFVCVSCELFNEVYYIADMFLRVCFSVCYNLSDSFSVNIESDKNYH